MKVWMKIFLPMLVVVLVAVPFLGCTSSDSTSEETAGITEPTAPTAPSVVPGVFSTSSTDTGFVWKPVSESDGKLVFLLPAALKGQILSAGIYADWPFSAENLIEEGRFTGDTTNGNRSHYRFSSKGGAFGQNVYAVANLGNDVFEWWFIPNGANRWEK